MDLHQRLQQIGTQVNTNGPLKTGATPQIPTGATKQSKLHDLYSTINDPALSPFGYISHGPLPSPSLLDPNLSPPGFKPTVPLRDQSVIAINNSFQNGTYKGSGPSDGNY